MVSYTCKIVGLISKKPYHYKKSFVQLTMKHRFGLSWVEITDVDFLRTEDQLRAGGRGEHSVHLKLLGPGEQDRIWPAVSEYKHYHGDGDHELDDGFNRSSDARGPQHIASLRFHRGTAPSVRSPASLAPGTRCLGCG